MQIEGDFASKEICSLCTRKGTDIVFSCFGSAGELNKFAKSFYSIHERFPSNIFMSIWKYYLNQANRPGLTISGVHSSVWQPAFQECCVLLEHLRTHTIELALVDKHLKYRGHQLTHEIHYLFNAVNAISGSNGNPFWIKGTVKKLEDYWKLCTYQNAANSILVLKQTMDLQGDFKIVETLAQEVHVYYRNRSNYSNGPK